MTSSLDQYPQRDGLYRVLPEGVAIYNRYHNRIMVLDALGSEFWLRSDGITTMRDIACDLAGWMKQPMEPLLITIPMILTILSCEGLMYQLPQPTPSPYHLSLPEEEQDVEQMRESMAASGWLKK